MSRNSLPVVTYHQVNNLPEDITEQQFDAHLKFFAENGYKTVFLKDWVAGRVRPDGKTLAVTFDDGYLDNWVYAFPILKKYGIRATLSVCTAWPMDGVAARPNLEDVWTGRCARSALPADMPHWDVNRRCVEKRGATEHVLNWEELRRMEASGLVDVQSHTQYHREYFMADQILDFYQNQNEYFCLPWATDGDTRWGVPIYPRVSAVQGRRYFDDPGLRDHLARHVGGPEYFIGRRRADYMRELMACAAVYRRTHPRGDRYETAKECRHRIEDELAVSKHTIEQRLDKECELICWPWGLYSALSLDLAQRVGYKGALAYRQGMNLPGTWAGTWSIKRFPAPADVAGLVRCLDTYCSPARAAIVGFRRRVVRKWDRLMERARDGTLAGTLKRKFVRW